MPSQFDNCAAEYHKFRPEYPESLFDLLVTRFALSRETLLADIGCGTARASLPFLRRGLPVLGIDPGLEMLATARAAAQELAVPLQLMAARGEAVALADRSVDFINCAQAFHWFDPAVALAEFHRILKPGGGLALYWNNRDETRAAYLDGVDQLIVKYNPGHKLGYRNRDWGAELAGAGYFRDIELNYFSHGSQISIEDFIGLTRSFSYVRNQIPPGQLADFEAEVRALLAQHSDRQGELLLPYRVDLWSAFKQ